MERAEITRALIFIFLLTALGSCTLFGSVALAGIVAVVVVIVLLLRYWLRKRN